MHPKFIDRVARRIVVTKREDGAEAAAAVAELLMLEYPKGSPVYLEVLARINYWREKQGVRDTQ